MAVAVDRRKSVVTLREMPGPVGDDDDHDDLDDPEDTPESLGSPPHPLDRVWRHPSELPLVPVPRVSSRAPRPALRHFWVALTAAGAGAVAVVVILAAFGVFDNGTNAPNPQVAAVQQHDEAVAKLVADIAPSIVAVTVIGPDGARRGSGVCVRHAGEVLTSDRLVRNARHISITTSDDRTLNATVRGQDPTTDLALLRVTGDLEAAPAADEALRAGDSVLAVGTASVGSKDPWIGAGIVASTEAVVSNLGGPAMDGMIATNAWPGKDGFGGALLDRQGGVAGILIAPIMGDNATYAVPIAFAGEIADQLSTKGTAAHGWLGVTGQDINGAPTVTGIRANGPAARAGIHVGDVVVSIGERDVLTMGEVTAAVSWYDPHASIPIKLRRAGTLVKANVTLGTAPRNAMTLGA